ncbi:MAG: ParB/RepB/Spo0J family partition protein, partial [Candidatus Sericytochromatia bacterium]|nr:ParB/RepB/Spo0J family partition protein [Candidatus Sericytochromatia bacterium]
RRIDPATIADDPGFQELCESVGRHGVLQPILVRPLAVPTAEGIRYQLVAGERRWRASQANGHELLPAIVAQFGEPEARIATLVENIQRLDVPPLEEAEGFRQTLDALSISQKELAQLIGKPYHYVTNRMKLLNLPESCREAVRQNAVSPQHAVTLAGFPADVRDAFLAAAVKGMSWQKLNDAKKRWEQVESFVLPAQREAVAALVARGQTAGQISRKLLAAEAGPAGSAQTVALRTLPGLQRLARQGWLQLSDEPVPVDELIAALQADLRHLKGAKAVP